MAYPIRLARSQIPVEETTSSRTSFGNFMKDLVFRQDVSFSGYERDKLFANTGGVETVDVSAVSGLDSEWDSRAVVVGDFDNDGRPDIFVRQIQGARLYRNESAGGNRWLQVVLEGRRSNRSAVGAVAMAWLPPGTAGAPPVQRRSVQCGNGFLSSSERRLHFGLGRASRIARLRVRWPSGLEQEFLDLPAGRTFHIVEGKPVPRELRLPSFRLGGDSPAPSCSTSCSNPAPRQAVTTR